MKLKVTVLFFVLAVALVFGVFRKDILPSRPTGADLVEQSRGPLTKEKVLNYFSGAELVSYSGDKVTLERAQLEAADTVNIHLWASWCAPCVNEVPELIEFAKQSVANKKNLKVLFLAVSLDEGVQELNKFLKSFPDFNGPPFVRIWDDKKEISKLLDADRLPMTIILDKAVSEPRVVRGVVDWKSVQL